MGALAKSAVLQLAFQFTISNSGKTYTKGNAGVATANRVVAKVVDLSCELKISTYKSNSVSDNLWYQSKWTGKVDGQGQSSKSGDWSTFLTTM
jgi:hypothetical protein